MRQLKILRRITNREEKSLELFFKEINNYPPLTPDEEFSLAKQYKQGNEQALEKLLKHNLRFLVSVAKQYPNNGLGLGDLINFGNLGLINAAKKYDETKGFKFISYAVWWIRQSILKAIGEQSRLVRIPLNKRLLVNKIEKIFNELQQKYERDPTDNEICEFIDDYKNDITELMNLKLTKHFSLDAPINENDEFNLLEIIEDNSFPADKNLAYDESLKRDILTCLKNLTPIQSEVIKKSFGIDYEKPYSLEEIGYEMNLSRERVRQIKHKGLTRLRASHPKKILQEYLI